MERLRLCSRPRPPARRRRRSTDSSSPPAPLGGADGCTDAHGIPELEDIAISPDGNTVYAGDYDDGVAAFSRDHTTGALTEIACLDQGAVDSCKSGSALQDVTDLAVSSDSKFVYAAADSGALAVLELSGSSLSQIQCFSDSVAGCSTSGEVLDPYRVAIAQGPAGVSSVYVMDGGLTEWSRNPSTGKLTYLGCRSADGSFGVSDGVCTTDPAAQGGETVAASLDGQAVYATSADSEHPGEGALVETLSRNSSTGALAAAPLSCLEGGDESVAGCEAANGLVDSHFIAVSPDGRWVEVGGLYGDNLATFAVEQPPACQPASGSTTAPAPVKVTLSCADTDFNPLTLKIVSPPTHGKLSAIAGGAVTYTPEAGFSGTDTFTYTATDGSLSATDATATIHITAEPAPRLTGLRLSHTRFRTGGHGGKHAPPLGTEFSFILSDPATVEIAITGSAPGLRSGHGCVAPTKALKHRHARSCTRKLSGGTLTEAGEGAGADTVSFGGRIGKHTLVAGRYAAVVTASDPGGHSASARLAFTVVG